MADLNGVTSGREGTVTWWSRQLTGTPHVFRGYVEVDGQKMPCGHDHRKSLRSRECARRLARDIDKAAGQREDLQDYEAGLGLHD